MESFIGHNFSFGRLCAQPCSLVQGYDIRIDIWTIAAPDIQDVSQKCLFNCRDERNLTFIGCLGCLGFVGYLYLFSQCLAVSEPNSYCGVVCFIDRIVRGEKPLRLKRQISVGERQRTDERVSHITRGAVRDGI